jgi:hypothetical protein
MQTYETIATVDEQGLVRVAGVPFEPGTEVAITIREKAVVTAEANGAEAADRAVRLFAALDKARNTESVGPLRREELYDRKVLR